MARKRTRNYRELRVDFDESEDRKAEDEEGEDEDEDEEEEDEEGAESSDEEDEDDEDEDDEAPRKKKKKKPVAKEAKPKRARASKANIRMKVVWGVFSNSNQRVATYPYPQKVQAEEHASRLKEDKNQTFFVMAVKEPIEEKKDK